ncbi:MAG: hypothetical protein K8T90_01690 [Planctomycetes bacterium]|nr:hypothetical protein [Planctomycetota bacterium]
MLNLLAAEGLHASAVRAESHDLAELSFPLILHTAPLGAEPSTIGHYFAVWDATDEMVLMATSKAEWVPIGRLDSLQIRSCILVRPRSVLSPRPLSTALGFALGVLAAVLGISVRRRVRRAAPANAGVALAAVTSALCASCDGESGSPYVLGPNRVDLGTLSANADSRREVRFTIRNPTDSPAVPEWFDNSCACASAKLDPSPVPARSESTLVFTINLADGKDTTATCAVKFGGYTPIGIEVRGSKESTYTATWEDTDGILRVRPWEVGSDACAIEVHQVLRVVGDDDKTLDGLMIESLANADPRFTVTSLPCSSAKNGREATLGLRLVPTGEVLHRRGPGIISFKVRTKMGVRDHAFRYGVELLPGVQVTARELRVCSSRAEVDLDFIDQTSVGLDGFRLVSAPDCITEVSRTTTPGGIRIRLRWSGTPATDGLLGRATFAMADKAWNSVSVPVVHEEQ